MWFINPDMIKTSVAILGAAHIHMNDFIEVLRADPAVQVKAVWDPDRERASACADRLGAEVRDDLDSILDDPGISAVVIASETALHDRLVRDAARAGKHMFVEKPLGMSAVQTRALVQAVEAQGALFHTGFFLRTVPAYQELRHAIKMGLLGDIIEVQQHYSHDGLKLGWFDGYPWMMDPDQAGYGAFGDLGLHCTDFLPWLLDDEAVAVKAQTGRDEPLGAIAPVEHFGTGELRFRGGALARFYVGWLAEDPPLLLKVKGTRGFVAIDRDMKWHSDIAGLAGLEQDIGTAGPDAGSGLVTFLDAVTGRRDDTVSLAETVQASALLDRLYETQGGKFQPAQTTTLAPELPHILTFPR